MVCRTSKVRGSPCSSSTKVPFSTSTGLYLSSSASNSDRNKGAGREGDAAEAMETGGVEMGAVEAGVPADFRSPCICLSRACLGLVRSGGRKRSRGAYHFPGAWVRPALGEMLSFGVVTFLKSTFTTSTGGGVIFLGGRRGEKQVTYKHCELL